MPVAASLPLRDAKNRLSEVVDQVEREHDRIVITRHGRPSAVMVSVDDLASLEETLSVLSQPRLVDDLRQSLAELAAGDATRLTKDDALALIRAQ